MGRIPLILTNMVYCVSDWRIKKRTPNRSWLEVQECYDDIGLNGKSSGYATLNIRGCGGVDGIIVLFLLPVTIIMDNR